MDTYENYTLYVARRTVFANFTKIEKLLQNLNVTNNILIRNLSSYSDEEKNEIIAESISAERLRAMDLEMPIFFTVFELASDEYFFIVSVLQSYIQDNYEYWKRVMILVFGTTETKLISKYNDNTEKDKLLKDLYKEFGRNLIPSEMKIPTNTLQPISFLNVKIDDDIFETLQTENYQYPYNCLFSRINTAIGRLLCYLFETSCIVINSVNFGRTMASAPVIYDESLPLEKRIKQIENQLNFFEHCNLRTEYFYEVCAPVFNNYIDASVCFWDLDIYSEIVRRVPKDSAYEITAIQMRNATNMFIVTKSKEKFSFAVVTVNEKISRIDVDDFGRKLNGLLRAYLFGSEDITISDLKCNKANDFAKQRQKVIEKWMTNSTVFSKYTQNEITHLYQESAFILKGKSQIIITPETMTNALYLIISGKVEMSGKNLEGFINPCFVLREGDIFGLEAFTEDGICQNYYTAFSDHVILLAIPKNCILEECEKHTEIYRYLLQFELKRFKKLEKLWLMV